MLLSELVDDPATSAVGEICFIPLVCLPLDALGVSELGNAPASECEAEVD